MKLKHLAAFLMLLALGCTQPASDSSTPAPDPGDNAAATEPSEDTSTDAPETETQLASATVKFDVTGMQ